MSFHASIPTNERLACSVRGCEARRAGVVRCSERHTYPRKFYGSPGQYSIRPDLLHRYNLVAGRYFKKHGDTPQLAAALAEAEELLALGREPEPTPYEGRRWHAPGTLRGKPSSAEWYAHREMQRLLDPPPSPDRRALSGAASAGRSIPRRRQPPVEPIEILKAVLPVFLASEIDPPLFDDAGLTFALGSAVCDLRPHAVRWTSWNDKKRKQITCSRRPGAKALRFIGNRVRDLLGLWLYSALAQVREDDRARAERRSKLRGVVTTPKRQRVYILTRDISGLVADEMTPDEYSVAAI